MANESTKTTETVPLREGFNGASKLQPATDFNKSLDGAEILQPQPAASSTKLALSTLLPAPSVAGASNLQPPPAATSQNLAASTPASAPSGSSQTQGGNGK